MNAARSFGETLVSLRSSQGFPTAYSFYKSREGRRTLGLTFRSYLNLEQGKTLPKAAALLSILSALGLGDHSPEARGLVEAYFTGLGLSRLAQFLRAPDAPPDPTGLEYVARQELERRRAQLSLEQWRVRAGNFDAHACHLYLVNTPGGASLNALARRAGLTPAQAERAVRKLAGAGLATLSRGHARSTLEGTALLELPTMPSTAGMIASLRRHRERLISNARPMKTTTIVARLSAANVARVKAHLDRMRDFVALCEARETEAGSTVCEVQGKILDLFPDAREV